jgi:peroxiredoxin Q/BCP
MIEIGQKAPKLNLLDEPENYISLNSFPDKNIVLYFYPKDDTPGCTKESIEFSQLKKEFELNDTVILGASKDSIKKHQKFIKKPDLTIKLLVDEDGSLCENYSVWKLKKFMGREYMGIERSTFLIDKNRIIKNIWRKVSVKGHVEEVFEAVKSL